MNHGIHADYVLMDTWFTNEPMIKAIRAEGLDVVRIYGNRWSEVFFKASKSFINQVKTVSANVKETVKSQLQQWICGQALFIQALFKDLSWES